MPESHRYKILKYLKEHKSVEYNVSDLHKQLNENGDKMTYQTVLKWIAVLVAEGEIKDRDYGNMRFVMYDGK